MNKDCIELAIKRAYVLRAETTRRAAVRMWDILASLWRGWRARKIERRFQCKLIDRLRRLTPEQKAIIHGAGMALDPFPDRHPCQQSPHSAQPMYGDPAWGDEK